MGLGSFCASIGQLKTRNEQICLIGPLWAASMPLLVASVPLGAGSGPLWAALKSASGLIWQVLPQNDELFMSWDALFFEARFSSFWASLGQPTTRMNRFAS